jgi:H+/Cl- antiporter ClcA
MVTLLFKGEESGLVLSSVRFFGPVLSFASGGAGGIFAPSLASGASLGSVIANLAGLPPDQANVIILAGMVAFLTGVTRSPFTSAILVLEMTDRHSVIFFLMLSGLVSLSAAWLIDTESLYDRLKKIYLIEIGVPATKARART